MPQPSPSLARRPSPGLLRRLAGGLLWLALALYFAFALLVLALRWVILPQIESYRPQLEGLLSQALNRPVSIQRVDARWVGLHPALTLSGLDIRDREGRSALRFEQVETELAWDSLLFMQLRLAHLEIASPELILRRDAAGRYYAAGLEITPQDPAEGDFSDWLLAQHRIVIRDARVVWIDEKRGAPPLALSQVNFQLDNRFSRHRFGLTAAPPSELAAAIDIRGDFHGREFEHLATWRGEAYADIQTVDLAGWQAWFDYPLALPRGKGATRLWLGFEDGRLSRATVNLALDEVALQLRADLPPLALRSLHGRAKGQRRGGGFELALSDLALATHDGIAMAPSTLRLDWQPAQGATAAHGELVASTLDLDALARLAAHLPLDAGWRQRLAAHRPRGRLHEFGMTWQGSPEAIATWRLRARLEGLALDAVEALPGLSGINGRVEANERGGELQIGSGAASVDLPRLFAQPHIEFVRLAADVNWRRQASGLWEVQLKKASFENADAAGETHGRWRQNPSGPGEIDLHAKLSRGNGTAVWRYMPLVVGQNARDWLRDSLQGGRASEAALRLKGDLAHFPFVKGTPGMAKDSLFRVTGKFHEARLAYASGWPEITGIDGELLFEGARMLISAKSGRIFNVGIGATRAEIADLLQPEELLTVAGRANGPLEDFLRFIEASPVGARIDHFTAPMKGEGKGELDLKLHLPLRHLDTSKVEGGFRFDGARMMVDADLPPLTEVRGQLRFSADSLESRQLRAQLLGMPLGIDIRTQGDGGLQVNAEGEMSVAALRRRFDTPLLEHLSGSTAWKGTVRVRKRQVEVAVDSRLGGIASSLPAPFNKSAAEALPLRFERKPAPAGRGPAKLGAGEAAPSDLVELSLGSVLRLQAVRRGQHIARASLALGGGALALPEKGWLIGGRLSSVDADFWRHALSGVGDDTADEAPAAPLPLHFDVRADELTLFDKRFRDIHLSGQRQGNLTRFDLKSPAVAGKFTWDSAGAGRITGRLGALDIPETLAQSEALQSEVGELVEALPALDLAIERLSFKGRPFGAVTVQAENRERYWHASFELKNDEAQLRGNMRWRPDPTRTDTRLAFDLDSRDLEKTLARLGVAEGVKRGTARIKGQMAWRGTPVAVDFPSFGAAIEVAAANGQFTRLEPGVGRLLGVLSLQSLPRRITLDFRDVFSEGFAFDSIEGKFSAERGILHTADLEIRGPAAKVTMQGDIDLAQETQQLTVKVQPALGESIAVGAMLANPVAGAVAWMAQKVLKNPLDNAFAFDYQITGSWKEPKVEKLGQTPLTPAQDK